MWNTMTPSFSGLTEILIISPRSTLYFVRSDFGSNTSISESETVKMWGTACKDTAHNLSQSHCLNTEVLLHSLWYLWEFQNVVTSKALVSTYKFSLCLHTFLMVLVRRIDDIITLLVLISIFLITGLRTFLMVLRDVILWQRNGNEATCTQQRLKLSESAICDTVPNHPFLSLCTSRNISHNVLMLFG